MGKIKKNTLYNIIMAEEKSKDYVHTFGRKKNSIAVALCRPGGGTIRVNGVPLDLVEPAILRQKVMEPVSLLGHERFSKFDIRLRVKGGGYTSQIYAVRLALARAIVAFHGKHLEEFSKREIKETLLEYDRHLLVADPRRCEPKKFGGRGARSRRQKSFR